MRDDDLLTFGDLEQSVIEWALDYGITPAVIIARLERGLSVEQAITTPMVTAPHQRLPIFSDKQRTMSARRPTGVVSKFRAPKGTGAGSTAQETSEISFSEKAEA